MRRPTKRSISRTWVGTDAQVVRHVRVCGEGHLATATRIELERQGIHRDTDYLLPSLRPPLVIACADSEADQSGAAAAQHALDEGSPLLLCTLVGRVVRLGPLIDPYACFSATPPASPELDQSLPPHFAPAAPPGPTAARSPIWPCHPPDSEPPLPGSNSPAAADLPLSLYARLGALLVSAQALNFLLGARNQCVLDRVVELNPWSMESKGYQVFQN